MICVNTQKRESFIMEFRQIISNLREDADLTQKALGRILNITQRKISYLENGKSEPNIEDIKAYCEFFDVSADYILGLTNDKRKYW